MQTFTVYRRFVSPEREGDPTDEWDIAADSPEEACAIAYRHALKPGTYYTL